MPQGIVLYARLRPGVLGRRADDHGPAGVVRVGTTLGRQDVLELDVQGLGRPRVQVELQEGCGGSQDPLVAELERHVLRDETGRFPWPWIASEVGLLASEAFEGHLGAREDQRRLGRQDEEPRQRVEHPAGGGDAAPRDVQHAEVPLVEKLIDRVRAEVCAELLGVNSHLLAEGFDAVEVEDARRLRDGSLPQEDRRVVVGAEEGCPASGLGVAADLKRHRAPGVGTRALPGRPFDVRLIRPGA